MNYSDVVDKDLNWFNLNDVMWKLIVSRQHSNVVRVPVFVCVEMEFIMPSQCHQTHLLCGS